jgi:hypothetical protein
VATKNPPRGRPKGSKSLAVADSAARAARLQRDGLGERAAARVVAWAEMTPTGRARATETQLTAGERRVRQRLDRALNDVGDALGNPASFVERLGKSGAPCHCDKWPYYRFNGEVPPHSHCAWCDAVLAPGARFCGKDACHRAAYWGSEDAAEAARAEAREPKNAEPPQPRKTRLVKAVPGQRTVVDLPPLSGRELLDRWDQAQSVHTPMSKADVRGMLAGVPIEGTSGDIPQDDPTE